MLETTRFHVSNGEGWALELKRVYDPDKLNVRRHPLLIVPGYGMNAFIFGYHPSGASMEQFFAELGLEVWSANFRNQGGSQCQGGKRSYSLTDVALTDLGCAMDFISEKSLARGEKIDAIGCSLGGTFLFIHLALRRVNKLGALVAIGAPLRWEKINPIMGAAFGCPTLVGLIPMKNIRSLTHLLFPLLLRAPSLLKIYLNRDIVDTSNYKEMLKTVDDPNRLMNKEIAQWIKEKDLLIDNVNVTEAVSRAKNPLLCVIANGDGIVPETTAASIFHAIGSDTKEILNVGTSQIVLAHADLFISRYAQSWVFDPIGQWLDSIQK